MSSRVFHQPAFVIVAALIAGLLGGAAIPAAEQLRPLALPGLFLQTLIAVGALAEARSSTPQRWAVRMLLIHHLLVSAPLIVLGLVVGLDDPLGAGAFLLGAVPPAAGLPSYAASCGAQVRPIIRFCLLSYAVGVVLTPALVLAGFGSGGRVGTIVATLSVGLVLPAILGTVGRAWLVRIPRSVSFTAVAIGALVVTLGLGPDLREAVDIGLGDPSLLWLAVAIGFGRCLWGAAVGAVVAQPGTRLESIMAGGYKNAVLAAVVGYGVAGPLAALPALLSLFGEAALLTGLNLARDRLRGAPVEHPAPDRDLPTDMPRG